MPCISALRTTALIAAPLLLAACDDLLPGQRRPPRVAVAESAPAPASAPKRRPAKAAAPAFDSAAAPAAFRQMSQTLRRLVAAEQTFFAENGTYSEDLQRLGVRPLGETQVEFLSTSKTGWAARATHPGLPGRDCVTYTGAVDDAPATRRFGRRGREGRVLCDDERGPARPASPASPQAEPAPAPVDTTNALDAVNPAVQMRVDLRKLSQAQAAYYGTQGLYSRQIERLPLQFGWQRGVSITLLHADQHSWSARATHESRPGKSCVVWFGTPATRPFTAAQRKVPARSGVAACDD
jgi:hypothetical protein